MVNPIFQLQNIQNGPHADGVQEGVYFGFAVETTPMSCRAVSISIP